MKFKQYINELYGESRTKSITEEEAIDEVIGNCEKNFKKMYITGPFVLYRGKKEVVPFGFIDTNSGQPRISANTMNYVTLLMDNLSLWKNWPKRSRGLVCSTSESAAQDYSHGQIYHIIPYDNAIIGICPTFDVWDAFLKLDGWDVPSFNDWLADMFKIFGLRYKNPTKWNELETNLLELDNIFKGDGSEEQVNLLDEYRNTFRRFGVFDGKYVFDNLNKIFDPKKNGFEMGIGNLKDEREVWIQGKCVLVSNKNFTTLYHGVTDEI